MVLDVLSFTGWALEWAMAVLLFWLCFTLAQEREWKGLCKALFPGMLGLFLFAALLVSDYPYKVTLLLSTELTVLFIGLLFFLPIGNPKPATIPPDMPSIDERDIMFARAAYQKGAPNYQDYYSRHPEIQVQDDYIRSLPGLCSPTTPTYDALQARLAISGFRFLEHMRPMAEGKPTAEKLPVDPVRITDFLKGLAKYHGARLVGITATKPYHFYSHRGRHPQNYGEEVHQSHTQAIVFAVEMDHRMVKYAPQLPVALESTRQYIEAAKIGMSIAYFIRELGYESRNHMDGNYLVCAPLVAHDAGIGELGRMGIIITEDFGPRVRLGVVTTDLPLIPDKPIVIGVQETCRSCRKCAQNCPSQAIPQGEQTLQGEVVKWKIRQEKCYEFWCKIGTDCAVCMKVCPYSKPDTLLHRLFRFSLRRSAFTRQIMVFLDDYIYGGRPVGNKKMTFTEKTLDRSR